MQLPWEGVSVASFYYWRRRLEEETVAVRDSPQGGFVPVRVLGVANVAAAASVSVFLPGGTRLEIPMAEGGGAWRMLCERCWKRMPRVGEVRDV